MVDRNRCEDRKQKELMILQRDILEALARGRPLNRVMVKLCRRAESFAPGAICTILRVDAGGRLHTLAAPGLPSKYSRAIDGLAIGPCVGSCGTAAFTGKPVLVSDIATDPLWADFRALVLPLGLRACWSFPILNGENRVIGTFAFYYRERTGPRREEKDLVRTVTRLCAIAMEQEETRGILRRLAFTDSLTGLANRTAFREQAEEALKLTAADGPPHSFAVLCLDLDGFKRVNDDLGHAAGDRLLVLAAERLAATAGHENLVARLGGDEFAILQRDVTRTEEVAALAAAFIAALTEPFLIEGRSVTVGCGIGAACAPGDGATLDLLVKNADIALYAAKSAGRNRFRMFDAEENARRESSELAENELRVALQQNEIEVFYQPIVDLVSRRTIGFEALARWRHPRRGLLPPSEFIAVAERCGLIDELGALVLRRACADASLWPADLSVAVNLSALQLRAQAFPLRVARILDQSRLLPSRLELELTETALLSEDAATRRSLFDIKELGVAIAIDDFGTGYSALSYLRAFPVDRLKIDRSFVTDMLTSPNDRSIIRAVIAMARDLGVKITAEGIETPEQLAWLRDAGCADGQGYLLGRPAPADQLDVFMPEAPARQAAAGA